LEQSGHGDTAEAASVLVYVAAAYIEERRFEEARQALEKTLTMFSSAKDAVPMDRIRLFQIRAALYVKQRDWRHAADDLAGAISLAESEAHMDHTAYATLLTNYAIVLRKNHRGREAHAIGAQIADLRHNPQSSATVDVTELLTNPKRPKR
jgi:Tfp pilus assembly protein PilF